MKELLSVQSPFILVLIYFIGTLVVAVIRGRIDQRKLGWIRTEGLWSFLWPRLRMWLAGLVAAIILTAGFHWLNNSAEEITRIGDEIGVLSMPILVIGAFIAFSLVLCLFMPFAAAIQESYELD